MNAAGLTLALYLFGAGSIVPDAESVCAGHDANSRNQEAIACYDALFAATTDRPARARLSSRLAWLHWRTGDYERALTEFHRTLALNREIGDRANEGHVINFIGLLYQITGHPETALTHYQQALEIAQSIHDRRLLGFVHYHLGWVNFVSGDYATAVRHYEQSLALRRETGDRTNEATTLNGLGMTHAAMSQFEKALQYHAEALPMILASGDRDREADARDHMGTALTALGRPVEAIEHHMRALQIRRESRALWSQTFSLSALARAYHALGRVDEAAARMKEVVDVIEQGRRKLSTRLFRASLYAGAHGHYARYIGYLMELRDHAGAFTASERSRARLTLDRVQEALVRADSAAGGNLVAHEQELRAKIEKGGSDTAALLAELRSVEEAIHAAHPKLAAARDEMPLDAQQIQSSVLDDESVLVEFALGTEKSFAWTVTRDAITGHELPPRAEIESIAVRLHELLSAGDQRAKRHELEKLMDRLSVTLIAPLNLPRARRLIVVPDGALFYIPFAALEKNGAALIESYEITNAPSASTLALLRRAAARQSHDAAVAVFADPVFRADDPRVSGTVRAPAAADPDLVRAAAESGLRELTRLPSTRVEAETIARLARGSRKALDFEASRATVISEDLGRYRVVHFATHALVNAQNPELSGIVLSLVDRRGANVDGFLRVTDLFGLNVQTDLVVLSACRTAMGQQLRGEGIVGLVSGFMHAGAPRVVASHWDVKDAATAELMKRFYRGMFAAGLSPSAALRAAQRSMRQQERFRSPYYWAAFSLYGLD